MGWRHVWGLGAGALLAGTTGLFMLGGCEVLLPIAIVDATDDVGPPPSAFESVQMELVEATGFVADDEIDLGSFEIRRQPLHDPLVFLIAPENDFLTVNTCGVGFVPEDPYGIGGGTSGRGRFGDAPGLDAGAFESDPSFFSGCPRSSQMAEVCDEIGCRFAESATVELAETATGLEVLIDADWGNAPMRLRLREVR